MSFLDKLIKKFNISKSWINGLWPKFLNADISPLKGYLALSLVSVIVCGIAIVNIHQEAQKLEQEIYAGPDDTSSYYNLLDLYYKNNWYKSLQQTPQKLLRRLPDNPTIMADISFQDYPSYWPTFYTPQTPITNTIEMLDHALTLAVGNEDATKIITQKYYDYGEYSKLEQAGNQILQANPKSLEAIFWIGQGLKYTGNITRAQQMFQDCANNQYEEDNRYYYSISQLDCYAEVLTATRELTLTLSGDHISVQSKAVIDPSLQYTNVITNTYPIPFWRLTWGNMIFRNSSGHPWLAERFYRTDSAAYHNIVTSTDKIFYSSLWRLQSNRKYFSIFPDLPLIIENLPLSAYTLPTTITLVTDDDIGVAFPSPPFKTINGNTYTWEVNEADAGLPFEFSIWPSTFVHWKLSLLNTPFYYPFLNLVSTLLATIVTIILFFRLRQASEVTLFNPTNSKLITIFKSASPFSWLFELMLFCSAGITVLYPIWLILIEQSLGVHPFAESAYTFLLPLILAKLALTDNWYKNKSIREYILSANLLFMFYLTPRLLGDSIWSIYLITAGFILWNSFSILVYRSWVFDKFQLRNLFSSNRQEYIKKILILSKTSWLEMAADMQSKTLIAGKIKADDYLATQHVLNNIVLDKKNRLTQLRKDLGISKLTTPEEALMRFGGNLHPTINALWAVIFGSIPFIFILVLVLSQVLNDG